MPFVTVNKNYGMQLIDTTQTKIVSTVQELKDAFAWAVEPSAYSSALIRIHETDDAGNHVITSLKNHKNQLYGRAKLVYDKFVTMTPEEAAAFFLATSDGEILAESIGQGTSPKFFQLTRFLLVKIRDRRSVKKIISCEII